MKTHRWDAALRQTDRLFDLLKNRANRFLARRVAADVAILRLGRPFRW